MKEINRKDETTHSGCVLTPHTLRLLKLIEDGTEDHARLAVTHLKEISSKCPPLTLWEILGRLQAFLVSKQWKTRSNAGLAMEGVAQNLPVEDQEAFLSQDCRHYLNHRDNRDGSYRLTSLTIHDLEGNLSTVLKKGRLLVAASDTRYEDMGDNDLDRMNQSCQGFTDFSELRLEMQRNILTRRLGLSNVLANYTPACDHLQREFIKQEDVDRPRSLIHERDDIGVSSSPSKDASLNENRRDCNTVNSVSGRSLNDMHPKKKRKRDNKNPNTSRHSIGALLTMEIRKQQKYNCPQDVSHRTAQALLAGELMFRIFDPAWHIRHGSLIGILSLIRAWKTHKRQYKDVLFGIWPHDIMVRALCVLALDRFGDYSGSSSEAVAGGIVAPVREMAGQIFAVVFIMSPLSLKQRTRNLLSELLQSEEWETRHGALLAIKYVVALMDKTGKCEGDKHAEGHLLDFFAGEIISRLEDPNDDVQGVASQILACSLTYFDRNEVEETDFLERIVECLWISMENIRIVSSSVKDLVSLFSKLIRRNISKVLHVISKNTSPLHGLMKLFSRTNELLDCDLVSVKMCVLHMIESLSNELTHFLHEKIEPAIDDTDKVKVIKCFSAVVKDVYRLYCATGLALAVGSNDDDNDHSDIEILKKSCRETWIILCKTSCSVFQDSIVQNELVFELLGKYFDVRSTSKTTSDHSIKTQIDHAAILVRFLCSRKDTETVQFINVKRRDDILEFYLLSYLDSPFSIQFEASCVLIQAIFNHDNELMCPEGRVHQKPALELCIAKLFDKLQKGTCSQFHNKMNSSIDSQHLNIITESFNIGYNLVCEQKYSGKATAARIINLWNDASLYPNPDASAEVTVDSMRLTSQIIGTLMNAGIRFLPLKLTPIVRPLMTSVQNEVDREYQFLACSYMQKFLLLMIDEPATSERSDGLRKTFRKVLGNLCRLIKNRKRPSSDAASIILGLLVSKLKHEGILCDLQPVWISLQPLLQSQITANLTEKTNALLMMKAVCGFLKPNTEITVFIFNHFVGSLVTFGCSLHSSLWKLLAEVIQEMCSIEPSLVLEKSVPNLILMLKEKKNDTQRSGASMILRHILDSMKDVSIVCPYVKVLLPITMSMMVDPVKICSEISARTFSSLVRIAPLVKQSVDVAGSQNKKETDLMIDHLIHGKKLSPCEIHPKVSEALCKGNIILRNYQREGISWLRFLQRMNLNGALCDSMGLGKTLQAVLGVSLAHMDCVDRKSIAKSLVVCPSSIVGHWINEIERYFPGNSIFRVLAFVGNSQQRSFLLEEKLRSCNLIVTSYEILRSEIGSLSKVDWTYCILDEGHLLRNPKTATARASRKLRARHRLILTGTPIQNSVNEIWATFDFLMPNFLGSYLQFSKEFSKPIIKGQNLDATAANIAVGMEKLKSLHQQVLPFIMRREKEQVLTELPPKIITRIPCPMSSIQENLYHRFCSNRQGKQSMLTLHELLDSRNPKFANSPNSSNPEVLKSLLYLRLLCTHPWLVRANKLSKDTKVRQDLYKLEVSGKLVALKGLLRDAGMNVQDLNAADNDSSLLYCDEREELGSDINDHERVLEPDSYGSSNSECRQTSLNLSESRCLIFCQFTHSLDIVEELLIKRHMPSIKYLRLDGKVPTLKRSSVVDRFNEDDSIKLMLLTTKIGGLGLNLTGADTVIFLEHDWNPFSDLQAMDRAHRIGQKRTVHVYQLVTMNSIEEKTMVLHERKLAMSKAIVNTENSSMHSMGTDRLLDIFQFRTESSTTDTKTSRPTSEFEDTLDTWVERYQDEYESLSLQGFLSGFDTK